MIKEMPLEVKAVAILRDSLEKAVTELNELLQEQGPQEFRDTPVEFASVVPNFDPEDLMKHEWKGKRLSQGQYAEGSLSWGWDFRENFKPETIRALEQDSILAVDKYEFTLLEKLFKQRKSREPENVKSDQQEDS